MSGEMIGWAWTLKLDTTSKLLLVYLADNADGSGRCPAYDTFELALILDRNNKTTLKALKNLEERQLLHRTKQLWMLTPDALAPRESLTVVAKEKPPAEPPAPIEQTREEPPEPTPDTLRMIDFCAAWGLTEPSGALADAWIVLEKAEAAYNRTEKHSSAERGKWTIEVESLAELMPQILHAVKVFQARAAEGIGNHADSAVEFVNKALWLAPEYQVSLTPATDEAEALSEAELDERVMTMNRKGGAFACHLKMTSKNPHTGETETETHAIYQKRVLAKWNQYLAASDYFTE